MPSTFPHRFDVSSKGGRFLRIAGLFFAFLFITASITRNLPDSPLKTLYTPIDKYVLTKLGFFHRGWAMFPTVTNGAIMRRTRYVFEDKSETITNYFPLRSSLLPSVWNEVMEDMMARNDTGDSSNYILNGFMKFECEHADKPFQGSGPLKEIYFETAFVPLYEQFTNYGQPYREPKFEIRSKHLCE